MIKLIARNKKAHRSVKTLYLEHDACLELLDTNVKERQLSIYRGLHIRLEDERYIYASHQYEISKNGQLILSVKKIEPVIKALGEIEAHITRLIGEAKKKLDFNFAVNKSIHYIFEYVEIYQRLCSSQEALFYSTLYHENLVDEASLGALVEKAKLHLSFGEYDKLDTVEHFKRALYRIVETNSSRKILHLETADNLVLNEDSLMNLAVVIQWLQLQNTACDQLRAHFEVDFPAVKDLQTVDALSKYFNNILLENKRLSTLKAGDFLEIGDWELEVNLLYIAGSGTRETPLDPNLNYKTIDELLSRIAQDENVLKKKYAYLKEVCGEKSPVEILRDAELSLNREVKVNLSYIRDILRFDSRIVELKSGTADTPQLICRRGDFGNTAFYVVSGKVEILLDQSKHISLKEIGRDPIKEKSMIQAVTQLFSSTRKVPEYRSKSSEGGSKFGLKENSLFLQDFSGVIDRYNPETAVRLNGSVFGEISAMGRTPRTATVIARQPAVLLEVRWQGLRDLRDNISLLKALTDANFRAYGLDEHLRASKYFSHLSKAELSSTHHGSVVADKSAERSVLKAKAEFWSFGDFSWNTSYQERATPGIDNNFEGEPIIASEGQYPTGLMLIRSGFARVSRKNNNGHLTVSYLGKGEAFGFEELKYNYENPHAPKDFHYSLRALGYTEVIFIAKDLVEKYVFEHSEKPEYAASRKLHEENLDIVKTIQVSETLPVKAYSSLTDRQGMVESLVANRTINGTQAMLINLDRCTRCDDCVVACGNAHDGNPRFIREGIKIDNFLLANACMHCNDPVCMIGCPTGAIHRDREDGQVIINDPTCIGCSTCANSCPYNNIKMVQYTHEHKAEIIDGKPAQKATKCDLCIDQPTGPAWVRACGQDALKRVDVSKIPAVLEWL
ncbi:MAG: cyclic nucleotide-binding domain-containing protein, partial [Lentisphaeraceae bacterium]|nr:cyclic nucleotide-binding domain-containing protein [Lentisphaeraceae bacterium]